MFVLLRFRRSKIPLHAWTAQALGPQGTGLKKKEDNTANCKSKQATTLACLSFSRGTRFQRGVCSLGKRRRLSNPTRCASTEGHTTVLLLFPPTEIAATRIKSKQGGHRRSRRFVGTSGGIRRVCSYHESTLKSKPRPTTRRATLSHLYRDKVHVGLQ